jgi:chromate transporter
MTTSLLALFHIFAVISILAFGGGSAILPEMQRQVVDVHGWMSAREFAALYALAQAAPGPNIMVVALVGWRVAGWQGFLVTLPAMFGPSSLLVGVVMRIWQRFQGKRWRRAIEIGLVPITLGLIGSGATVLTLGADHTVILAALTLASVVATLRFRLHPLWILAAGALVGLTGLGQ